MCSDSFEERHGLQNTTVSSNYLDFHVSFVDVVCQLVAFLTNVNPFEFTVYKDITLALQFHQTTKFFVQACSQFTQSPSNVHVQVAQHMKQAIFWLEKVYTHLAVTCT